MKLSRMVWAWKAGQYYQHGWNRDGGIWPMVRLGKEANLGDFLFDLHPPETALMAHLKGKRNNGH